MTSAYKTYWPSARMAAVFRSLPPLLSLFLFSIGFPPLPRNKPANLLDYLTDTSEQAPCECSVAPAAAAYWRCTTAQLWKKCYRFGFGNPVILWKSSPLTQQVPHALRTWGEHRSRQRLPTSASIMAVVPGGPFENPIIR